MIPTTSTTRLDETERCNVIGCGRPKHNRLVCADHAEPRAQLRLLLDQLDAGRIKAAWAVRCPECEHVEYCEQAWDCHLSPDSGHHCLNCGSDAIAILIGSNAEVNTHV